MPTPSKRPVSGPGVIQARRSGFMGALVYPTNGMSTRVVRAGIMMWNRRARQVGAGQLFQLTDKPYMADVYIEGNQEMPEGVAAWAVRPGSPGSPTELAQFRTDVPNPRDRSDQTFRQADRIQVDEDYDSRWHEWYDVPEQMRTIPPTEERIQELMKEYPWVEREWIIKHMSTEYPGATEVRTVPLDRMDETAPPSTIAHELGHTQGLGHKNHAVTPGVMRYGPDYLEDQRASRSTQKPTQQEARQVARNQGQSTTPSKGPKHDARPVTNPKKVPGKRVVTGVGKVKQ